MSDHTRRHLERRFFEMHRIVVLKKLMYCWYNDSPQTAPKKMYPRKNS